MNITLIGFKGTGKTTICRLLAQKTGKKLVSIEEEIEKRLKQSKDKFVKIHGLERFHDIESEIIERVCDFDECVFDTAHSIVLRNENITNLKRNSLVILLTADLKALTSRVKKTKGFSKEHINEMREIFRYETKYKDAADYTIDTTRLKPEEICDLISHYVQMELQ